MERAELESLLAQAIGRLPRLEKTILNLYYYEELTLREIATVVGLHESRVSQLKSQAILRLRSLMARQLPAMTANPPSPSGSNLLESNPTPDHLMTVSL